MYVIFQAEPSLARTHTHSLAGQSIFCLHSIVCVQSPVRFLFRVSHTSCNPTRPSSLDSYSQHMRSTVTKLLCCVEQTVQYTVYVFLIYPHHDESHVVQL